MKQNNSASVVHDAKELQSICTELGLKDIRYLPSPKKPNGNVSDLARHATIMLKIYRDYTNGDKSAPYEEIFADEVN